MRTKKFFKKMMAVAFAAATLVAFSGEKIAMAGTCQGSDTCTGWFAERHVSSTNTWTQTHRFNYTVNNAVRYATCTAIHQGHEVEHYCPECGRVLGRQKYVEATHTHPYCDDTMPLQ